MNHELPTETMPEAELTLRLAIALLEVSGFGSHAKVAIDGAHVRIKGHYAKGRWVEEQNIFDIAGFLSDCGFRHGELKDGWQGKYTYNGSSLDIKPNSGFDVQVNVSGRWIRVECKGGPIVPTKGKSPNAILASAIGQVICEECVIEGDDLWVAIPDSPQFQRTAERIATVPAFCRSKIKIVLVNRHGEIRLAHFSDSDICWIGLGNYFKQILTD